MRIWKFLLRKPQPHAHEFHLNSGRETRWGRIITVRQNMIAYKFRSFDQLDHIADILVSERLYCPLYHKLNDPFEGMCIVRGIFEFGGRKIRAIMSPDVDDFTAPEDLSEKRLCSLSGSFSDVRLWSHYGGGHSGVAIEVNLDGFPSPVHKVTYNEGLRKFDQEVGDHPSITSILTNKTDHWQYEDEYRIFSTEPLLALQVGSHGSCLVTVVGLRTKL